MSAAHPAGNESADHAQKLKASVVYITKKICLGCAEEDVDQKLTTAIAEAAWKKMEKLAVGVELNAKHAGRTTVNAEDVKMEIRRNHKLLAYINNYHDEIKSSSKSETNKIAKKAKR